jgi:plasmid stability protein
MIAMANLTLSVDDELLRAARVRAVSEGTSVNEICRKAIEAYVRADSREERLRRFDDFIARMHARVLGPAEPSPWNNREEFYEEVLAQRLRGGK